MAKPILILQFRPEKEIREHEQTCFNEYFKNLPREFLDIIKTAPPTFKQIETNYSKVILGGSSLMLSSTKQTKLSQQIIAKTKTLISEIIKNDFPALGICFGAQLIAHHIGIPIINNPSLAERGTYLTKLTTQGKQSRLFKQFSTQFFTQMGHLESLQIEKRKSEKNKKQLTILSTNPARTQIHAFRLNTNIYATVFHPELTYQTQIQRAKFYMNSAELQNFIDHQLQPSPHAARILANFIYKTSFHFPLINS
jgi:GMP synthase (glutamine-hydrolysing)